MKDAVEGLGFQWWGGQILPAIRKKYPYYKYMQTESECGSERLIGKRQNIHLG